MASNVETDDQRQERLRRKREQDRLRSWQRMTSNNSIIQQNKSVKYFGVIFTDKLSWSEHITNIANKANSIRALLQRNLNQCQLSVKSTCYTTYVHPILEYGSIAWSPRLPCDVNKLEMVQHQSTRFVYNDFRRTSNVTTMLNDLHWPTLETTCRRHQAKILNYIITVPHDHLIRTVSPTQGHNFIFIQLASRSNTYLHSFFPLTVRLWNTLPSYVVD